MVFQILWKKRVSWITSVGTVDPGVDAGLGVLVEFRERGEIQGF